MGWDDVAWNGIAEKYIEEEDEGEGIMTDR